MDTKNRNNDQKKEFTQEEMLMALFELETMFDRMPAAPWFLLYPTCNDMAEHKFLSVPISVGIKQAEITKERMSVFKTYFTGFQITDSGMTGFVRDVPVVIRFVKSKYDFLQNLQTIHYENEYYKVPNPLSEYNKIWKLVK